MFGVTNYYEMLMSLGQSFREHHFNDRENVLTGIVFARPNSEFVQKEFIPNVNYWHHRTGKTVDFFCAGYIREKLWLKLPSEEYKNEFQEATVVDGQKWLFSDKAFATFTGEVEKNSSWKYREGCELIVLNARSGKRDADLPPVVEPVSKLVLALPTDQPCALAEA